MTSGGEVYDLVVAGAGPAGCALAARVAGGGARVLLLEREPEPGNGRAWIVDVERNTFRLAGVPEPVEEASWPDPERQVMVPSGGGRGVELSSSPVKPIRNDIYVRQLAGWAVGAGAELRTGCTVTGPLMTGDSVGGVLFVDREGRRGVARAKLVADCTGISGAVRRGTPPSWGMDAGVTAFDTVVARREVRRVDRDAASRAVSEGVIRDRVRVDRLGSLGSYSTETVYLDIEGGYIDILVGVKADAAGYPDADGRFEELLSSWRFVGEPMFGDGGPIPIRRTLDSLAGDGLVVLGDSACQVIPAHGSGTASALIAAGMASRAASRALSAERFDRAALWGYCHEFQSGRGAVLAYYYALRRHSETLSVADIDRLVGKGLLAAKDIASGLVPEPFRARPSAIAKKVLKGAGEARLLAGSARAGLIATMFMRHYRRYPEHFSEEALRGWIERMPRAR